jgi:acetylornithine deacetylase/succinyl-diaminopimelate desuccinylase-like protein
VTTHAALDPARTTAFVDRIFAESIVGTLVEYIKIPNKSPMFDEKWQENGHMERAVQLLAGWAKANAIPGMTLEVVKLEGRTPLIFMEIPAHKTDSLETVVLYGHLDKQPEMTGWREGLGPWTPVLEGEKLYGRGGADDGYSTFASLTAVRALRDQDIPHARCVILIEACEESGSYDLPAYIEHLADRIGQPSLVVCLDSGCGNYDQLWLTTSLRGVVTGTLSVELLREGVHSGDGSGVVASSFRVLRQILSRLEDEHTGDIRLLDLYVQIPRDRITQAAKVAEVLGDEVWNKFPLQPNTVPVTSDLTELVLNRTWRPALSVVGAEGFPPIANAGNVLRPRTAVKLSLRLPPTLEASVAIPRLKEVLEASPPYGAKVEFAHAEGATGWNAPALAPWLERSLEKASNGFFGQGPCLMGEGGSIPFMGMLGKRYPEAQFLITGVLGPASNAHGPNEFLDLPTARRLTACVASVLADHLQR